MKGMRSKLIRFAQSKTSRTRFFLILILATSILSSTLSACSPAKVAAAQAQAVDLTELSLEELMKIEVISVAKREQKVMDSSAAVFVITQEDIRRSGVTSIPEALRMVPGLQVARIDANKWAITSRGFNERFANKLLVLVDGRSVYTPLFSGVYWDVQDTLLEDVERIEVIRGPGATLWGANAVNGVINIITKHAKNTQGGLVTGGVGTQERGFGGLRYGAKLGENTNWRVYGMYFNRDESVDSSSKKAFDDWKMWRTGFRTDWEGSDRNSVTLQGDIYYGKVGEMFNMPLQGPFLQIIKDDTKVSGTNLLGRWKHDFSGSSDIVLQLYYDWTKSDNILIYEDRHTFDLDFQHRFLLNNRQDILWGLGYHFTHDKLKGPWTISFDPDSRGDHVFSAFVQDDITLIPNLLRFTLGSKFEYNDYTGFEFQPNARILCTPNRRNSIWMAISRAVRTPSRTEHDVRINFDVIPSGDPMNPSPYPMVVAALGDRDFDSENLLAYELGYRVKVRDHLTLDIAAFYNDYDKLRTIELGKPFLETSPAPTHLVLPAIVDNKMHGKTYGVELAADYQVLQWWRVQASYSYLQIRLHVKSDSTEVQPKAAEGQSPHHQFSIRSSMDLPWNLELDLWSRYVGNLPNLDVKSYVTLDARLAWHPTRNLEISIMGQNLLDARHPEFGVPFFFRSVPTEVERSVYGKITWRF